MANASLPFARKTALLAATTILSSMVAMSVHAGPEGGNITGGTGTIDYNGDVTDINQDSQRLNIDWQSFSTDAHETVNFYQPGADSVAINKVIGGVPSHLRGALNANGRVFILNESGVTFHKGSQTNVGALLATTAKDLNIDSNDRYVFVGEGEGSVINHGDISVSDGGFAVLSAPYVKNSGRIVADLGQVSLGSAQNFTVDLRGDNLVTYQVSAEDLSSLGVDQKGKIRANGGSVDISTNVASKIVESVINLDGVIDVDSFSATGNGGNVTVRGNGKTILKDDAKIYARGGVDAGHGGRVQIGGANLQLGHGTVKTARNNSRAGELVLHANKLTVEAGNGTGAINTVSERFIEQQSEFGQNLELRAKNIAVNELQDGEITGGKHDIGLRTLDQNGDLYSNGKIAFAKNTDGVRTFKGDINMEAGSGGLKAGNVLAGGEELHNPGRVWIKTHNGGDVDVHHVTSFGRTGTASVVIDANDDLNVRGNIRSTIENNGYASDRDATAIADIRSGDDFDVAGSVYVRAINDKATDDVTTTAKLHMESGVDNPDNNKFSDPANLFIDGNVEVISYAKNDGEFATDLDAIAETNVISRNDILINGNINVKALAYGSGLLPVDVIVEYLSHEAAYHNLLGFYMEDAQGNPIDGQVLFNNIKNFQRGDTASFTVGDLNALGFFLVPDAGRKNGSISNDANVTFKQVNGEWAAFLDDGTQLKGMDASAYFTQIALNKDGIVHEKDHPHVEGSMNWEDLIKRKSDKDYDDANFNVVYCPRDEAQLYAKATLDMKGKNITTNNSHVTASAESDGAYSNTTAYAHDKRYAENDLVVTGIAKVQSRAISNGDQSKDHADADAILDWEGGHPGTVIIGDPVVSAMAINRNGPKPSSADANADTRIVSWNNMIILDDVHTAALADAKTDANANAKTYIMSENNMKVEGDIRSGALSSSMKTHANAKADTTIEGAWEPEDVVDLTGDFGAQAHALAPKSTNAEANTKILSMGKLKIADDTHETNDMVDPQGVYAIATAKSDGDSNAKSDTYVVSAGDIVLNTDLKSFSDARSHAHNATADSQMKIEGHSNLKLNGNAGSFAEANGSLRADANANTEITSEGKMKIRGNGVPKDTDPKTLDNIYAVAIADPELGTKAKARVWIKSGKDADINAYVGSRSESYSWNGFAESDSDTIIEADGNLDYKGNVRSLAYALGEKGQKADALTKLAAGKDLTITPDTAEPLALANQAMVQQMVSGTDADGDDHAELIIVDPNQGNTGGGNTGGGNTGGGNTGGGNTGGGNTGGGNTGGGNTGGGNTGGGNTGGGNTSNTGGGSNNNVNVIIATGDQTFDLENQAGQGLSAEALGQLAPAAGGFCDSVNLDWGTEFQQNDNGDIMQQLCANYNFNAPNESN